MGYIGKVLVTGASSGIGKATAELLATKGYQVYALSRHASGLATGCIVPIKGDVTDEASLEEAFSSIDSLDAVVHCAGVGVSGSAECIPLSAARRQMDVNYFGVLSVNRLALPLLRKNKVSHVVIVSSFAGLVPIPYQSHYSSSKYALEAYGEALQIEAREFGVKVSLVEPGDTRTGFTSSRTHDEPEDSPYFRKYQASVAKMEKDEKNGKSPETVAKVILKALSTSRPRLRYVVGADYKALAILVKTLPLPLKDWLLSTLYNK